MTKKIKLVLLVLILMAAVVLTGCFGNNDENHENYENGYENENENGYEYGTVMLEGFELFRGENFEIQHLSDWDVEVAEGTGDEVTFFAPGRTVVVGVRTVELEAGVDLSAYLEVLIEETKVAYSEGVTGEIDVTEVMINDYFAYMLTYELSGIGDRIEVAAILFVEHGMAFVVTINSTDEAALNILEEMLGTFVVTR